jgi:hypothetical protein
MTRPRAADDFLAIRARMYELRGEKSTRPRAADDFATIRQRIDELSQERAAASTGPAALPYRTANSRSRDGEPSRSLAPTR